MKGYLCEGIPIRVDLNVRDFRWFEVSEHQHSVRSGEQVRRPFIAEQNTYERTRNGTAGRIEQPNRGSERRSEQLGIDGNRLGNCFPADRQFWIAEQVIAERIIVPPAAATTSCAERN